MLKAPEYLGGFGLGDPSAGGTVYTSPARKGWEPPQTYPSAGGADSTPNIFRIVRHAVFLQQGEELILKTSLSMMSFLILNVRLH